MAPPDHHPILWEMCDLSVGGATVLENVTSAPVGRRFDSFVSKVVEQSAQVLTRTDAVQPGLLPIVVLRVVVGHVVNLGRIRFVRLKRSVGKTGRRQPVC